MDAMTVEAANIKKLVNLLDSIVEAQHTIAEKVSFNELESFRDKCKQILDDATSEDGLALVVDEAWVDGFAQCIRHMLNSDATAARVILKVGSTLAEPTASAYVLRTTSRALYNSREDFSPKSQKSLLNCITECIRCLTRVDPASLSTFFHQVFGWVVNKAAKVAMKVSRSDPKTQKRFVISVHTLLLLVANGGWDIAIQEEKGVPQTLKFEVWSVDFVKSLFTCLQVQDSNVNVLAAKLLAQTAALFGSHTTLEANNLGIITSPELNRFHQLHKFLKRDKYRSWTGAGHCFLGMVASNEQCCLAAMLAFLLMSVKFSLVKIDKKQLEFVLGCLLTSEDQCIQICGARWLGFMVEKTRIEKLLSSMLYNALIICERLLSSQSFLCRSASVTLIMSVAARIGIVRQEKHQSSGSLQIPGKKKWRRLVHSYVPFFQEVIEQCSPDDPSMFSKGFMVPTWFKSAWWGTHVESQLYQALEIPLCNERLRLHAMLALKELHTQCGGIIFVHSKTICKSVHKLLHSYSDLSVQDLSSKVEECNGAFTVFQMMNFQVDQCSAFEQKCFAKLCCRLCECALAAGFAAQVTSAATAVANSESGREFADGPAFDSLAFLLKCISGTPGEDILGKKQALFESLLAKRQSKIKPSTAQELTQFMITRLETKTFAKETEWRDLCAFMKCLQQIHSNALP